MAHGGDEDLVAKFQEFCTLAGSKNKCEMTSKAAGKLVADCWDKKYKSCEIKQVCDASVFPTCKEKGKQHMVVNKANVDKFVSKASHEIAKKKCKNARLAADAPEVEEVKKDLVNLVCCGGPNVKQVKTSATGNVAGMTDASKYTGTHGQRFDADGKGKGIDGREDRHANDGYVGNYKNKDTYGAKK